ncbi:MAG: outer membrane protein assembly factor BamA [Spirochaetales bacterium]|nr:outer membrane protein assembly factor BamA [Spirochaetales bacterium]HPO02252.1 outer membrane protein assembly factor BamA [Treponemataceae bacterium]
MRTKLVALLLLVFCLGAVNAQTSDDWYQDKPIRAVTFNGLKHIARSELDGVFSSYLGKPFTDELYWEILQKMYALEYFETIDPIAVPGDPDKKTVNLQFTVSELPVISRIEFKGNRKLRQGELLEKIALKEGDIYNELKARMDERSVRDYYLEKGYAGVKIVSEAVPSEDSSLVFRFTITEGKQTVISAVNFEGNRVMAAKNLRGVMTLKEAKLLTPGTFREMDLEADKLAIRRYYTERGYIDAKIETVIREVDADSSEDKNLLKLTFVINEGDQYTYGGTTISGNTIFTTDQLLSKIRLNEGDVMNQNRFDEGFQAVADVYFENGYTSNYINRQELRNTEQKRVSWVITVVESQRSHIEHIIIKGNTKTKLRVIERELLLEDGDIFSKSKLMDSLRNLHNLRYFSVVAPDLVQGSEENLVDIVINLEEQSTASVQFGVTFSGVTDADTFPLSAFVQWEDKNFMGNGQTFSTNITASPDTQSVALGYSENWFLGSPLTVSFNLSLSHKKLYAYRDEVFPLFDNEDDDDYVADPYNSLSDYESASSIDDSYRMQYEQWSYSLGSSTGYRWNPRLASVTLKGGVTFSVLRNMYDSTLYRPADRSIREHHGSWGWENSVWTRLSLDRRDIYYDPTTGWFASQQFTVNGILPEIESDYYFQFDTKAEGYLKLLDYPVTESFNLKFILAAYSSISVQVPFTDLSVSDSNKLYPDGMFTGYGWTTLYSYLKGNVMLDHRLEFRVPFVPGVIAGDWFLEGIAVKESVSDLSSLSLNDYYGSFGPSIRFSIPQFPLRLMLANTFRIQDGEFEWGNKVGPDWKFVLSFNISNL